MIIQPAKALIDNEIRSSILNIKTDMLFNDKEAVNAYCDPPQFISSYLEWITSGGNFKIFGFCGGDIMKSYSRKIIHFPLHLNYTTCQVFVNRVGIKCIKIDR